MCGIVGKVGGNEAAAPLLLEGLRRLEYRGYDSAGIATLDHGTIARVRAEGKLINLQHQLEKTPLSGTIGIGHTRWATHGVPNEANAHPHATEKVAVVHNGIIENFQHLRSALEAKGYVFHSQTDSETVPVLITSLLDAGLPPHEAVKEALGQLEGAFSLGILFASLPDTLYCARRGAPLCLGLGDGVTYFGSDPMALAGLTNRIIYLEDGDWAQVDAGGARLFDASGQSVERAATLSSVSGASVGKGNHRHYMLKEIHEQPSILGDIFSVYVDAVAKQVRLPELPFNWKEVTQITLVACGTSFYAANVAKYWLESLTNLPITLDIASEFRYRRPYFPKGGLVIGVSQSGETADTLAALRMAKRAGQYVLTVVNTAESTMAREAHAALQIYAGPEIGVASTKAFTAQLSTFACLALAIAAERGEHTQSVPLETLLHALTEAPTRMLEVLHREQEYATLAQSLSQARDILYLGRGTSFPLAMEGALKLKEISYIHAEGYAAGELKHGPIALIDEHVPIIALAPQDEWFEKTLSNIQEAAARGGKIVAITDAAGAARLKDIARETILLPDIHPFAAPLLYAVPMQLLAYHIAVAKGTDVDQPRNLAKSVTVE